MEAVVKCQRLVMFREKMVDFLTGSVLSSWLQVNFFIPYSRQNETGLP